MFDKYIAWFFIFKGRTSIPYAGGYCLSKFAVEGFTDALRIEMCKREMKIILIEPGFFKTNMTDREKLSAQWDKLWSELSNDLKMEYGDEFLEKSKVIYLVYIYICNIYINVIYKIIKSQGKILNNDSPHVM